MFFSLLEQIACRCEDFAISHNYNRTWRNWQRSNAMGVRISKMFAILRCSSSQFSLTACLFEHIALVIHQFKQLLTHTELLKLYMALVWDQLFFCTLIVKSLTNAFSLCIKDISHLKQHLCIHSFLYISWIYEYLTGSKSNRGSIWHWNTLYDLSKLWHDRENLSFNPILVKRPRRIQQSEKRDHIHFEEKTKRMTQMQKHDEKMFWMIK